MANGEREILSDAKNLGVLERRASASRESEATREPAVRAVRGANGESTSIGERRSREPAGSLGLRERGTIPPPKYAVTDTEYSGTYQCNSSAAERLHETRICTPTVGDSLFWWMTRIVGTGRSGMGFEEAPPTDDESKCEQGDPE